MQMVVVMLQVLAEQGTGSFGSLRSNGIYESLDLVARISGQRKAPRRRGCVVALSALSDTIFGQRIGQDTRQVCCL
jgi:hypothetical protein